MRLHLGHHFYGAGNLGDDFMLAGFLSAMTELAPGAKLSCCVPFPLAPLRRRFPTIAWLPYDRATRERAIAGCDAWLGLGGSPFQSAHSRWFIDHLLEESALCAAARKPVYFLGIGVQRAYELEVPEVRRICGTAAAIWTRDTASAERMQALTATTRIKAAADVAHLYFAAQRPPAATQCRVNLVANFDYGLWPGRQACLEAIDQLGARDRVWLVQETRELPGAERALYASLPLADQARWRLLCPEIPGAPLASVLGRWGGGEWLVSSRYHAALAGAWAGSRIVVIATNEKLRGAAAELGAVSLAPDADLAAAAQALANAKPAVPPVALAAAARTACDEFVRSV